MFERREGRARIGTGHGDRPDGVSDPQGVGGGDAGAQGDGQGRAEGVAGTDGAHGGHGLRGGDGDLLAVTPLRTYPRALHFDGAKILAPGAYHASGDLTVFNLTDRRMSP